MLKLHFINVGDGDAILAERLGEGAPFRMLMDAGRPDVGSYPGSLRCTAAAYLRALGVRSLDMLVVSHLHIDHFGGLAALLPEVAIGDVYAGFFPETPCCRLEPDLAEIKTLRGLAECLDAWGQDTQALRAAGCRLHQVERSLALEPVPGLRVDIICPDETAAANQRAAWADMLAGRAVDAGYRYWSAKYRNPGSLRMRLTYAGRRIELAGDCYGAAWEEEGAACDILKVPHHADAKSMTERLAEKLRPGWTVISCGAKYNEKKDRPSQRTAEMFSRQGSRLLLTDCFSAPWHERPDRWQSAVITIEENGAMIAPEK